MGGGLRGLEDMGFLKWGGKGLTGGEGGRPIGMGWRAAGVRGSFGEVSRPAAEGGWQEVRGGVWCRVAGPRKGKSYAE